MQALEKAAKLISRCEAIIVGAGAGMGKDSGLPDFRGNDGFWNNYPPYKNKFNFFQCANPQFLLEHPDLFWGFYGHRLQMYRQKKPHEGYQILKEFANKGNTNQLQNIFAVTSNVDGHFLAANYSPKSVYQVHGSIHYLQCQYCQAISENSFIPKINFEEMSCSTFPVCPTCKEIQRPNILMFNDYGWIQKRSIDQNRNYKEFLKKYQNKPLTLIEIGCGTVVPTIRNMMEQLYYRNQLSSLVRINPDEDHAYKYNGRQSICASKDGRIECTKVNL